MKTIKILCIALSAIFFTSCSKSKTAQATIVKYAIEPMNIYFTEIAYIDNNGNEVVNTNPSDKDSVVSFSIRTKPFNAKLVARCNNVSTATVAYTMVIFVNGQPKQFKQLDIPPQAIEADSIMFTIQ